MESMVSAIVTVEELLGTDSKKIGYFRNIKNRTRDEYDLPEGRILNIPGYQREIRWSTHNIQVLVDDVMNEPKFLGIVLASSVDNVTFDIIDGQQRLTAIMMLISAINKRTSLGKIDTVAFTNESFENVKEAIEKNFYIDDENNRNKCILNDTLNQYDALKRLSEYSTKIVNDMEDTIFRKFKENLLECDINLLIQPIRNKKDQKRVCVDYFIDINNKNVELDYIDILKAYAFKEDLGNNIEQWINIQKKSKETIELFNYSMETMFLHYMLCEINRSLNNGVKSLSDKLKLTKETKINDIIHEPGTDIEILINDSDFYTKMLTTLDSLIEFMKVIPDDKSSYGVQFEKYINPSDGDLNDEFKQNMFVIINGIIRCSDTVPKLLLMKYYVEVINNKSATRDDYKLIYPIGVLTAFFSAGKGDLKNRKEFSSLVLNKNWKNIIEKKSKNRFERINIIEFGKEIKNKGTYNEWSGQFLARRIHAILYSAEYGEKVNYHPDVFRLFNEAREYNDEHFIINQSYCVGYSYGKNNENYRYPEVIKSYVSHLGNYLFIKRKVNSKLDNKTVKDKILTIEDYLTKGEVVFLDRLSEVKYSVAKEVFISSQCPMQSDLKKCSTKDEAEDMLNSYYTGRFHDDYNDYIEKLRNILSNYNVTDNVLMHRKKK